jgi:hypothetical protein
LNLSSFTGLMVFSFFFALKLFAHIFSFEFSLHKVSLSKCQRVEQTLWFVSCLCDCARISLQDFISFRNFEVPTLKRFFVSLLRIICLSDLSPKLLCGFSSHGAFVLFSRVGSYYLYDGGEAVKRNYWNSMSCSNLLCYYSCDAELLLGLKFSLLQTGKSKHYAFIEFETPEVGTPSHLLCSLCCKMLMLLVLGVS